MEIDITASVDMGPERLAGILLHPTSFPGPYGIGDLGRGAYDFIDFMERYDKNQAGPGGGALGNEGMAGASAGPHRFWRFTVSAILIICGTAAHNQC